MRSLSLKFVAWLEIGFCCSFTRYRHLSLKQNFFSSWFANRVSTVSLCLCFAFTIDLLYIFISTVYFFQHLAFVWFFHLFCLSFQTTNPQLILSLLYVSVLCITPNSIIYTFFIQFTPFNVWYVDAGFFPSNAEHAQNPWKSVEIHRINIVHGVWNLQKPIFIYVYI